MGRAVVDEDEGLCCSASIGLSGHCTCILACADSSVRGMARAAPAATGEIPLIMPVVVELVGGATWPLSAVGGGSSAGALAMSRTSVGLVRKGGVCGSSEGVPPPSKMSRKGSRSASSYCLSFRAFFSFFFSFFSSFFSFFLLSFLFFSRSGVVPLASMLVKITISPYVPKSRTLRSSRPPPSAVVLAGQFGHDVQGAVSDVVCPLPHRSLLGEVLAVIRSRSGG